MRVIFGAIAGAVIGIIAALIIHAIYVYSADIAFELTSLQLRFKIIIGVIAGIIIGGQLLRYISQLTALLLFLLMFIISYEVIMRYAYNSPTIWAWILNQHIWLVTMLIAGIFAFQEGSHIRIEVLYDGFKPQMKMVTKVLTLILFWFFATTLAWKGYSLGESSYVNSEIARGPFSLLIWPFKAVIPLTGLLILYQGSICILSTNTKTGLNNVIYKEKDPHWFNLLNKALILILFWVFSLLLCWRWIDHTIIHPDNGYRWTMLVARFVITVLVLLLAVAVTKHFVSKNVTEEPDPFIDSSATE